MHSEQLFPSMGLATYAPDFSLPINLPVLHSDLGFVCVCVVGGGVAMQTNLT